MVEALTALESRFASISDEERARRISKGHKARQEAQRRDVLILRKRGLVPLAIADVLGLSDFTVARHLRELAADRELEPLPLHLEKFGPKREPKPCPHCGRTQS